MHQTRARDYDWPSPEQVAALSGASFAVTDGDQGLNNVVADNTKPRRKARKSKAVENVTEKKGRKKRKAKEATSVLEDITNGPAPERKSRKRKRAPKSKAEAIIDLSDAAAPATSSNRDPDELDQNEDTKPTSSKKRKRTSKEELTERSKKRKTRKREASGKDKSAIPDLPTAAIHGEDESVKPSISGDGGKIGQEGDVKRPKKRRKTVKTADTSSYFESSEVTQDAPKLKKRNKRRKKTEEQSLYFSQEVEIVQQKTATSGEGEIRLKRKRKSKAKQKDKVPEESTEERPVLSEGKKEKEIPNEDQSIPIKEKKVPKKRRSKRKSETKTLEIQETEQCIIETQSALAPSTPPQDPQEQPPIPTITKKKTRKRTQQSAESSTYFTPPSSQTSSSDKPKTPRPRKKKTPPPTFSQHFTTTSSKNIDIHRKARSRAPKGISTTPWPPFDAPRFGLIQEELKNNPFHVLIAVSFLNRTRGLVAIPMLHTFLEMYPTPEALAAADVTKVINFLQPLGLYNSRGNRLVKMAQAWLVDPPTPGKGVVKADYPPKKTKPFPIPGRNPQGVDRGEKWEVAHLPGSGAYAIDSWRIFCRDEFLGVDQAKEGFEPEWKRVVPMDKELRAWVRWMWAKEGVQWVEVGPGEEEEVGWGSQSLEVPYTSS